MLIISSRISFGQETKTIDFLGDSKRFDFSNLWTLEKIKCIVENDTTMFDRPEPLGFIGEDYQRFFIHFISVIQNPKNSLEYFVYGKSKVKNNICSFQGLITITKAQIYEKGDFPAFKQGFVTGKYEFYEDPDQNETGIFKGAFQTNFYIDQKGKLKYDALMAVADGFDNNQFEGTWTNYKKTVTRTCNWGDFRIPNSQKLDCGAGEFGPTDEYLKNGWENYRAIMSGSSDDKKINEAIKKENLKWWIDK